MDTTYYKIHDLNLIGKEEEYIPYLYKNGVWEVDKDHIIDDRKIGYDELERTIGNSDMLFRIDEIKEEEALRIINSQ